MLLKSRKPGPRAKVIDLPTIAYGSEYQAIGSYFHHTKTTVFRFPRKDVEKIARLVHGNLEGHMKQHKEKQAARALKGRRERIRAQKIKYHEERLEVATGKTAVKHEKCTAD